MKFLLPLGGLASSAIGVMTLAGWITFREGYVFYRLGLGLLAAGLVMLGYWAFANQNKDYNF